MKPGYHVGYILRRSLGEYLVRAVMYENKLHKPNASAGVESNSLFVKEKQRKTLSDSEIKFHLKKEAPSIKMNLAPGRAFPRTQIFGRTPNRYPSSVIPPDDLYFGTSKKFLSTLRLKGVQAYSGRFVQLSSDAQFAYNLGRRYGDPLVFLVSARKMYEEGMCFYRSSSRDWLTLHIPYWHMVPFSMPGSGSKLTMVPK